MMVNLSQLPTDISKLTMRSCSLFVLQLVHSPLHTLFRGQSMKELLVFKIGNLVARQRCNEFKRPRPKQGQASTDTNANGYVGKKLFVRHDLFQGLVDRFIYLTSEPWKVVDMAMFETPTSFERIVYVRT